MADEEYNKKLESLQQYIPFLNNMIVQLKDPRKKNREQQLQKMVSLHSMITDKKKKLKLDTLIKCEDVILKLYDKVKTGVHGQQPHHNSLQLPKSVPTTSSLATPRSPSPPRDVLKTKPVVIPTEKVVSRNYHSGPASVSSKPKIDVYGSAGDSLIRQQRPNTSKTSVFERLGYRRPDMSKPPISLEDLEALKADINAAVNSSPVQDPDNMSLFELTDLREKLQKQLKTDDSGPKSHSINTTIRNTTILTKKAVDKSPIRSPADKSPIRAPEGKSPIKKPTETPKPLSDFEKALLETKLLVEKKLGASKKPAEKLVPDKIVVEISKIVDNRMVGENSKKPVRLEFNNDQRKSKTTKVLKEPASIFGSALSSIDNQILVGTKGKEKKEEKPSLVVKDKKDDRRNGKERKDEQVKKEERRSSTSKESKSKEKERRDSVNKEEKRPETSHKNKEKINDRRDEKKKIVNLKPEKIELLSKQNDTKKELRDTKISAEKPKISEKVCCDKKRTVVEKPKVVEEKVKEIPTFKRLADKYNPKPRKPSLDIPLPSEPLKVVSDSVNQNTNSTAIPFLENSSYKSPPQAIVKPVRPVSPPKPVPLPQPVNARSNLITVPIMSSPSSLTKNVEKEVKKPEPIPVQITNILSNPKTNSMIETVVNQFKGRQTPNILHNQNNFGNNFQNFQPNDNLHFNQPQNNFQVQQVPMQQHVPLPQPVMPPHIPVQHVPMHPQSHYQPNNNLPPRPRPFTPFEPIAEPQFVPNQVDTQIPEYYPVAVTRPVTPSPFVHHATSSRLSPAKERPPQRRHEDGYYEDWRRESGEARRPRDYREPTRDPREATRISRETVRESREIPRDSRETLRDRDPREASRDPRLHRDPRRVYGGESRSYRGEEYRSRDVQYEREGRLKVRDSRDPRVNRYAGSSGRYDWGYRGRSRSREKEGNFMSPLDSLYAGGDPYKKTGKGYGVQGFRIPKVKKEIENDNKPETVENEDKNYEQISDGSTSPEIPDETTNVTSSTEREDVAKEDEKLVEKNEKVGTEEISSTNEIVESESQEEVKPNNETDTIEAFLSKLLQNDETRAAASKFIENVSGSLTDERLKQIVQTIKAIQPPKDETEDVTETKEDTKSEASPAVETRKSPVRNRGKKRRKKSVSVEEKVESDEDKEQVVVSVGERIKERRRLADIEKAKPKKPKAKPKTELDLLHADIQEMFIRDGVLTATGKRLCNIWHNDQTTTKTITRSDTRSRRVSNLNSSTETGDEDGKRYSLRSSKGTSYAENSDEDKYEEKKTDEPQVVEEPEPEKEPETVKPKVTKVKKRGSAWASGVLPKRKKIEKHSTSDDKSEGEGGDKSLELVEPEKTYFTSKPWLNKFPCKLCDFYNKGVIFHYKSEHPDSEVLASRLSLSVAEEAIEESTQKNLDETGDVAIPFIRNISFQCRFCHIEMFCRPSYFYDHITIHTGEYRYFCEHCPFMTANSKRIRLHQRTVHGSERTIKDPVIKNRIYGYICVECNFVQLDKKTVENHVNIYHLGEGKKIYKIAMSTCPEDRGDAVESSPVESTSTKRTSDEGKEPKAKKARVEESNGEEESTDADAAMEIEEDVAVDVPPPEIVKKEIDMTVFTCNTDIQKENEKIEEERLKTMTELNDCVKTNRQSLNFVDELSNRLSNSLMRKSPELTAIKMEPTDEEAETEDVYDKIVEETTMKMTQPPTEPPSVSVEVVQKDNAFISGMIQKLKGILKEETEGGYDSEPPPLSLFDDETKNVVTAGCINLIKNGDQLEYQCRASKCFVTIGNRDEFLLHLQENHETIGENSTKCRVCQEEISGNLVTFFDHVEQNHEHLLGTQRKILKPRRLSGDMLSKSPEPIPVEVVAPITIAEITPLAVEEDDNPFPFKIAGVMSLAEDPLPPLSPITEKKSPASPAKTAVLESIVLKESKLTAPEKTITWKSSEAYKKFLQCTRELYKCPQFFCKFATNWRHLFESHIKAHAQRNDELVACVYCDVKTPLSQSGLHIDLRHANCLFSCSQCLYRAVKREFVMVHMKTKHKDGVFMVIALPPKTFKAIMMSGPKNFSVKEACIPYKCGQEGCTAEFLFQDEFTKHLQDAHCGVLGCGYESGKFSCSYKCVIPESMLDHWRHHKCFPYHCLICKVGYMELYSMLEHYTTEHPNQEPNVIDRSKAFTPCGYGEKAFEQIRDVSEELFKSINAQLFTVTGSEPNKLKREVAMLPLAVVQKPSTDSKITLLTPQISPPNLQLISGSPKRSVTILPPSSPPPLTPQQPSSVEIPSNFVEPEFVAEESPIVEEDENGDVSDPLSLDNEIVSKAADVCGDESDSLETNEPKTFGLIGYQLYRCAFCEVSFSNSRDLKAHCVNSQICVDHTNRTAPLKCVHCEKRFRTPFRLLDHIQYHGLLRYSCSLCVLKFPTCYALKGHMRLKHSVTSTVITPLIPDKNNADQDEFVLRPKPVAESDIGKDGSVQDGGGDGKNVFSPSEIDSLPKRYIFNSDIRCALCNFSTKVRTNLVRHLQLHSADKSVPDTAPVNPVPCLDKNEKMFDKMTNLAISSFTGNNTSRMGGPKPEPKVEENAAVPGYIPSHRRYVCCAPGCNYICPEESNLRHHLFALHEAESSFICVHCKSELKTDVEAFMKHLKLHDTRLYKCSACVFIHNLRHKVERHSAEKHPDTPSQIITVRCIEPEGLDSEPQPCSSSSIINVSTGSETVIKRPWSCGMCKCRSATKTDIIAHIENKHDINTQFKCTLCSYKTNEKETFDDHFKESHPDNEIDIINVFYKNEGGKPGISEKSFDTTPLWQRDRPRVRHIRGILFEEGSTPAAAKLSKKIVRTNATTNLDLAIDAVAKGIDDTARTVERTSKSVSDDIFKMLNDQIKEVEEVDGPVITIEDDPEETEGVVDEITPPPPRPPSPPVVVINDNDDDVVASVVVKRETGDDDDALVIDVQGVHEKEVREKLSEARLQEMFKKFCLPIKHAYRCPYCLKFKTRKIPQLIHHIMTEQQCNRFSCQNCDFNCVALDAMTVHNLIHETSPEGSAGVISLRVDPAFIFWLQLLIQYQSKALLESVPPNEGSEIQTTTNKNECTYCKRWYKNFHALKEHELFHWSQHSYSCTDCDTEFFSIDQFFDHSFSQHSSYSLKTNGPSVEKVLETLKTPITSQTGPSQIACLDGQKTYLCFYCMESKATMEELNEHWKESHQADNVTFNFKVVTKSKTDPLSCCTYCHEKGSEEWLKKHHNDMHQGLKFSTYQLICLECSSTFRNVKELRNHFTKTHVGKKLIYSAIENKLSTAHDRYQCIKCPFRSASTGGIRAHVRKHLRPIDCKLCGATFVHPTEARMHHNKEHMHNPEVIEENKERLRDYEAIIKKIIGQKESDNKSVGSAVKQRVVARKSTGAPFKRQEEYSFYGVEKEIVDLKNISTSIEVNKVNTRISAEQFSNIFNIFPVVEVEDCAKMDT